MKNHHHYILHKPYGYLSQFVNNQSQRRNKKLLGELADFPEGTMSIGRLDQGSEGLLFLTTDGKLSAMISSKKVEKEYQVQVDGKITTEGIDQLKMGVKINIHGRSYKTLPCPVHRLDPPPVFKERSKKIRDERHGPTSWLSITLREGKFRQVRKMTAAVGFPTLRLIRVRIGNIELDDLEAGQFLKVNDFGHMKII